jgi:hypothetical protein
MFTNVKKFRFRQYSHVIDTLTILALAFGIAENIVGSANFLPEEPVTIGTDTIYFSI